MEVKLRVERGTDMQQGGSGLKMITFALQVWVKIEQEILHKIHKALKFDLLTILSEKYF